ncbi:GNAT family N-acetyltransferase [Photobacterium sp. DNB23_23_1]|uniref:GNAT family N-acetyltransferase n=1 Tax=Photobacterium pectinilyticum TaxID=2906793 RepID=A0ABT1N1W6_9GAMM|nr:GNAT family protein [Photobacterium sp. ZSDE20]MCQ1057264.1 GNAT family N-acetyltransferase [Photobacterium sp. ZSDE20]MDD1821722.1 GNAT family N-acetyltransferase [Photobacterium sp. ZSDE20]
MSNLNENSGFYSKLKQGESVAFHQALTIRLIQPSDLSDIITMLGDEKVNQYLFFAPADESLYQGFFTPIIENTQEAMANGEWPDNPIFIIRDQQGRYMGMAAITQVMFCEGNYEVGYQLPAHSWGQGIATSACQLMTELGFTVFGSHKISADCYGANVGSYKTLEKCGYQREGCQKDYYKLEQGFDDKVYYGITAAQFFAPA